MLTQRKNYQNLPLIMGMTTPSPILEMDDEPSVYDEIRQIVYCAKTVGTKCLKTHTVYTHGPSGRTGKTVKKNEIDDSKYVK